MTLDDIILAIEAEQYDYEASLRVPGLKEIRTDEAILRISEHSSSLFANKVVRSVLKGDVDEQIRQIIEVYASAHKQFSWWIGPTSEPSDLALRLMALGFEREDVYVGLAASVKQQTSGLQRLSKWQVEEAVSSEQLRDVVAVSAAVWGMDEASAEASVRERELYMSLPDRRGAYLIARDQDGRPVGNGAYRISSDGRAMYLTGSAVLPAYREQGIYHALLAYRFALAAAKGCDIITVQARLGTSEPVLRRLGFEEYGQFEMYVSPPLG